jgi:hypothetical protein
MLVYIVILAFWGLIAAKIAEVFPLPDCSHSHIADPDQLFLFSEPDAKYLCNRNRNRHYRRHDQTCPSNIFLDKIP